MTKTTIKPWYEGRKRKPDRNESSRALIGIAETHPYIVLVLIKFLVGVRLFLTIYILTKKHIPFRTYLLLNLLANTLFVCALLLLSWAISRSTENIIDTEQSILTVITLVVVVAVGGNIVLRLLTSVAARYLKKCT